MSGFMIEEFDKKTHGPIIKVIGVGGGGSNMINHMIKNGFSHDIDLITANTDAQALNGSLATTKIQLGGKLTNGLGAGMKPEVGRKAALKSYDEIKSSIEGADIVFVAAGLGGGTGSGASAVIAQAAKEIGAITVSIVTKPFIYENRKKIAEEALKELKKESDSIVIIPNDKLMSLVDKSLGIKDSFKMVDDILARAVSGMTSVVLSCGQDDINIDFADVKTIMEHRGTALLGVGEASGENGAIEATKKAIESPLLEDVSINGARGVIVHFYMHPSYPLSEVMEALKIVHSSVQEDSQVIFGTTTDENIEDKKIKVTIIATGFEKEEKSVNKTISEQDFIKRERITRLRKVSGGYEGHEDMLEIPTFLRNQMD